MLSNIYFRDLASRQNQNVTEAQIHLYLTAKRYYKNDIAEAVEYFKNVKRGINLMKDDKNVKQIDLEGKEAEEKIGKKKETEESENGLQKYIKEDELEEIENKVIERLFVYQRKIILVDNDKNILRLKYKSDLFDDLMYEFRKLYEWLDFRAAYLKFFDSEGNEHVIDKTEVKTVIHFLDKLNKIKKDDEVV